MGALGPDLGSALWFRRGGKSLTTALQQRARGDRLVANLADDLLFGRGHFAHSITINPPSGFIALPIAQSAVLLSSNSLFAHMGGAAARNRDQAVLPTTYSGGTITWETSGGYFTGRIASVTGPGDGLVSIDYWREYTRATTTFVATMQGGAIVSAFAVTSNGIAQQQTIGNATLGVVSEDLGANGIAQQQTIGSPTLTQTNQLTPNGVAQQQAVAAGSFTTTSTYARAITLNPPAGYTARPVLASIAVQTPYSLFSYLGFAPADGDQVLTPNTWDDDGTPRAITWAVDGSGHPTGVVSSVANGPATIDLGYWRQSTQEWSEVTLTVVTPVTLTAQGLVSEQFLANGAAIPEGALVAHPLVQQQAIAVGFLSISGAPVKYSRAITLSPPAGRAAYPISATTINLSSESVFQLLVGTPVTGDQAAPPISYVDSGGVTRSITWELDPSGNMTGRIAEIEGNGLTTLTIPYWDSVGAVWYAIIVPLQDYQEGLVAQGIVSVQTLSSPSIAPQGALQPQGIVSQQILFPANLGLSYTLLPNPVISAQALGVGGLTTLGTLGAFPIISVQDLASPSLTQLHELLPAPVVTVQALGIGPLNAEFQLAPDALVTTQALGAGLVVSADTLVAAGLFTAQILGTGRVLTGESLMPHRIDTRQYLQQVVLNMPSNGSISAKLTLYPAIWGKISLRSD